MSKTPKKGAMYHMTDTVPLCECFLLMNTPHPQFDDDVEKMMF